MSAHYRMASIPEGGRTGYVASGGGQAISMHVRFVDPLVAQPGLWS